MTRFLDSERADLEFGRGSKKTKVVGCPKCKTARSVNVNWYGGICSSCNNYFNIDTALPEDECEYYLNQNETINEEFVKNKSAMEKRAYEWKDKQMKKRAKGNMPSYEPGGKARDWGKK